jgi:peptidoglycan hydrolase-like protein with peptidoglycan-binding domain
MGSAVVALSLIGVASAAILRNGSPSSAVRGSSPVRSVTVVRSDLSATERINGALSFAPEPPVLSHSSGTYTWLPSEGALIGAGQALFTVDDRPTVLFLGQTPAWRPLQFGIPDGPDVHELEDNLVALGFDPASSITVDDHFSAATAAAIQRWQSSVGEPPTGVLDFGDVAFEPEPVRVGTLARAPGQGAQPGDEPYTATSSTRVVTISLDASRQQGIALGMTATIDLLDGHTTSGTVSFLGKVATIPPSTGNTQPRPVVTMLVTPNDPAAVGDLDQAPVQIELVTDSRHAVLVVPIVALLALPHGHDGLEVIDQSGRHHLVPITTGLFTDSMVEIRGRGVAEGTNVVAAQ